MSAPWYHLVDAAAIPSPALVVHADRVGENLRRTIALAGGVERLRPHVKTHKTREIVRQQLTAGIDKFKCATLAEAALTAECGARDVLLAYQTVGPSVELLARLARRFPQTRFSVIADDAGAIAALGARFAREPQSLDVFLDLDVGMHRTGVAPGEGALAMYNELIRTPGLRAAGLHIYDGHLKQRDVAERSLAVAAGFAPVEWLIDRLSAAKLPVGAIVAGGSNTFAIHARDPRRQVSPGTFVFWDASYLEKYPDLDMLPAAVLVTRVVSRPTPTRACVDLGFKSVASDNPNPRALFLDLPDAKMVIHSEEHLVFESPSATRLAVGDVLYALPYHVCPTVALYPELLVARDGMIVDRWAVAARDRFPRLD
ncbi:MAG: D-TA family PLP-dependent enzyme [Pirellulales bacterium]|nr:D-TA family PLP-dependent enzyme [Pirellulales bacterium]